ncbi:MAG TPA: SRPBCC family protein [Pyrinomonadaceae bacterium]|nr:SRPBCC family protein [Pyrinomonadaceae bacterium]
MAASEETLTNIGQGASASEGAGEQSGSSVNVGQTERWVSALGGGALALYGLTRGSLGGIALALAGAALVQRGYSGHCNLYEAIGYSTGGDAALRNSDNVSVPAERGTKVEKSVTIDRPASDLYSFWRNFENLPQFMNHLESVRSIGNERTHWVAKAPAGTTVEWDAEVYNDKPNELIAWRTLEGSQVSSAGSVRFEEAPNGGTEVRVSLKYDPPGGKLGSLVARLFGENPERQIEEDLGRFKELMESMGSADAGRTAGRGASAGK